MPKPRLRPRKGWRFRIILCDKNGEYEYDDFDNPYIAPNVADRLMRELLKKHDIRRKDHTPPS